VQGRKKPLGCIEKRKKKRDDERAAQRKRKKGLLAIKQQIGQVCRRGKPILRKLLKMRGSSCPEEKNPTGGGGKMGENAGLASGVGKKILLFVEGKGKGRKGVRQKAPPSGVGWVAAFRRKEEKNPLPLEKGGKGLGGGPKVGGDAGWWSKGRDRC